MADTEFGNKLNSALRYGGSIGGTIFVGLSVLSQISPEQVIELKADLEGFNQSVFTAYGYLMKMWIILGPVLIFWLAKIGWSSSSVKAMAGKMLSIATNKIDPGAVDAKIALINAAASPSIGTLAIVNPVMAAHPETPSNVVANATLATAPELAKSAAAG